MWSVDGASVRIVHEGNADDIDRELLGLLNVLRGVLQAALGLIGERDGDDWRRGRDHVEPAVLGRSLSGSSLQIWITPRPVA